MWGKSVRGVMAVIFSAALMTSITANTAQAHERAGAKISPSTYGGYLQPRHGKRGFWRHKYYKSQRRLHRAKRFSYRQWGRQCRPVSRVSLNRYGNPTTIGGTQCLNRYGEPYIVRGSRYIVN